jgi:hypothetical protein
VQLHTQPVLADQWHILAQLVPLQNRFHNFECVLHQSRLVRECKFPIEAGVVKTVFVLRKSDYAVGVVECHVQVFALAPVFESDYRLSVKAVSIYVKTVAFVLKKNLAFNTPVLKLISHLFIVLVDFF